MQIFLGIRSSDSCGAKAAFRLLNVKQLLSAWSCNACGRLCSGSGLGHRGRKSVFGRLPVTGLRLDSKSSAPHIACSN